MRVNQVHSFGYVIIAIVVLGFIGVLGDGCESQLKTEDIAPLLEKTEMSLGRLDSLNQIWQVDQQDLDFDQISADLDIIDSALVAVIRVDSTNYSAWLNLAFEKFLRFRFKFPIVEKSLVRAVEKAAKIAPDSSRPLSLLADYFSESNKPYAAIECRGRMIWQLSEKSTIPNEILFSLAKDFLATDDDLWASCILDQIISSENPDDVDNKDISELKSRAVSSCNPKLLEVVDIKYAADGINFRNDFLDYQMIIPAYWKIGHESHEMNDTLTVDMFRLTMPPLYDSTGNGYIDEVFMMAMKCMNSVQAEAIADSLNMAFQRAYDNIRWEGPRKVHFWKSREEITLEGEQEAIVHNNTAFVVAYYSTVRSYKTNAGAYRNWREQFLLLK